jgi:hypothetical protein
MGDALSRDRKEKREALPNDVDKIVPVLQVCGAKSEELGTLSPEAGRGLRTMGRVKRERCTGVSQADPVTEMIMLEQLAWHDLTSAWCTMVGATGIASLGTGFPQSGLEKVFTDGNVLTAAISILPAGRAVRNRNGLGVSGRCRFSGGIRHAAWAGGTVARALMYEGYEHLYDGVTKTCRRGGDRRWRAICVHTTDLAIENGNDTQPRNSGRPVLGGLSRDLNIAGLHQVMSDTANENHGNSAWAAGRSAVMTAI